MGFLVVNLLLDAFKYQCIYLIDSQNTAVKKKIFLKDDFY